MSEKNFFLKDDRKQCLYIVDYKYKDEEGVITEDTWLLALTVDSQLHNLMEVNRRSFEGIGYELVDYSFTKHSKTHNDKKITFESMRRDECEDR